MALRCFSDGRFIIFFKNLFKDLLDAGCTQSTVNKSMDNTTKYSQLSHLNSLNIRFRSGSPVNVNAVTSVAVVWGGDNLK